MLKGWQGCFLFCGVAVLLQLFPITGVFLMILAAPLWSVILINLGFALMARDAWREADQRYLMIFPLLWFGGYLLVAAISHWQAYRLDAALAAANAGQRIAFDPARQDLVIEPDETDGSDLTPTLLVERYGLDSGYAVTNVGLDTMRGTTLLRTGCPDGRMSASDGHVWLPVTDGSWTDKRRPQTARWLCQYAGDARPQKPVVRVQPHAQVGRYDDARVLQDVTLTGADGKTVLLRSGWSRPLAWLPQPIIGCALDSGAPAWRCFAEFRREWPFKRPQGTVPVVTRALGLREVTIRERLPNAGWH